MRQSARMGADAMSVVPSRCEGWSGSFPVCGMDTGLAMARAGWSQWIPREDCFCGAKS